MRRCSNPVCRREVVECNGTVKAGDWVEALEGKRLWTDVRELCPKCSTFLLFLNSAKLDKRTLALVFGWSNEKDLYTVS